MSAHNTILNRLGLSLCLNLLVTSAIFLAAIPVQSQDKKEQRKSPDVDEVIKISSNLVNVDVMVKDKKGKAITDLKAEDFVLSENGVKQNIEYFRLDSHRRQCSRAPAVHFCFNRTAHHQQPASKHHRTGA